MTSLLDTDVILRFLTADTNHKYKNLCSFFGSIETGDVRVELKLIVLFQVIFVLQGYYKVPREKITDGLLKLISYKGMMIKEKKLVRRSLELWRDNNHIEIVDCYLIACLEGDDKNILYSDDRGFGKFNINRIEP
ncbi:MAG: hypothetical protein JW932_08850 [Deltaproteobacteria bacterium]|nr:hypothetical protein [Deltaproteobacteria bacterium]